MNFLETYAEGIVVGDICNGDTLFIFQIARSVIRIIQIAVPFVLIILGSAGDAVTDRAGLAGHAAALDIHKDIKLIRVLRENKRLANDRLKGLKSEIIIDITLVDRDLSGSRYEIHACDRAFPSSSSVKSIRSQSSFPPIRSSWFPASEPDACAPDRHRRRASWPSLFRAGPSAAYRSLRAQRLSPASSQASREGKSL